MNSKCKNKPTVINLHNTKYPVIQHAARQIGLNLTYDHDLSSSLYHWDIKWADVTLGADIIKKMRKHQRINYFIGISSIARKNLLMVNLYTMKKYFPNDYNFFPETFQYPLDCKKIVQFLKKRRMGEKKVTFIVKPEASCQGKGIYLCQSLKEIETDSKSIVQEYISKPMLYDGLKFDFRVYVLLKSIAPLQIYIYKQGLVRFATEKYQEPSQQNLDDLCLHLTNYAVNKLNPKYQFNQTMSDLKYGHKKSIAEFFKSLQTTGYNSNKCWRQIKQCINKTIIAVQPHLHSQYRKAQPKNQCQSLCFQILGFDFMMDQQSKVYLLEVNQSPSFSTQTPLDFLIKNYLIKDTLKIILWEKDQKKGGSSQYRIKRIKTQNNEDGNDQYNGIQNEIPGSVLGNYERIFPSHNNNSQILYNKMLQYIKADYHKTKFHDNSALIEDGAQVLEKSRSKSPELQIEQKTKERLSEKYEKNGTVQKTKSLSRQFQISKVRSDLLGLAGRTKSLLKTEKQQNVFPLIGKQPYFSFHPNINKVKVDKILTINMTPVGKSLSPELIQKTLTCSNKSNCNSNERQFSLKNQINTDISLNKSISINGNQKIDCNMNHSICIPQNQSNTNNIQNLSLLKVVWQNNSYRVKKQAFRSQLRKLVKYKNPIQKISQQRTLAEQEKEKLRQDQML